MTLWRGSVICWSTSEGPIEHPLLKENASGSTALLAIGSRKGLCGSYNNSLYRLLEVHRQLAKADEQAAGHLRAAGRTGVASWLSTA